MSTASQGGEHGDRFGGIAGLAQHHAVEHHQRIGGDDQPLLNAGAGGAGLGRCQAAGHRSRRFARQRRLVHVSRRDHSVDAQRAQQLRTAR